MAINDNLGKNKPDYVEGSSNGVHTRSMGLLSRLIEEFGAEQFTPRDVRSLNGRKFSLDDDLKVTSTSSGRFGRSHINYLVEQGFVSDEGEGKYVVNHLLATAQLDYESDLELERQRRSHGVRDDSSRGSDNYDENSFP
ncbi:MAG: hypothetical protein Q8P81_00435 [Nanoarchaeota archaeon]|nr:hypothetical protein [Nanoarchaeota archaeon]